MNEVARQVKEELTLFDQRRDMSALVKASEIVERIEVGRGQQPGQRTEVKRVKLDLWLSLLNAIDKKTDPTFNPQDVPELAVTPPLLSGQATYAGMDPKDIKDPVARREYEQAIEKNSEKTRRYSFQRRLAKYNAEYSQRVETYIKAEYPRSTENRSEVDEAIAKYITNPRRAAALRALVSE